MENESVGGGGGGGEDVTVENLDQDDFMEVDQTMKVVDRWADEILDEEIKILLAVYENGKTIPVDMVAHFEYFYNTLDFNFKT